MITIDLTKVYENQGDEKILEEKPQKIEVTKNPRGPNPICITLAVYIRTKEIILKLWSINYGFLY